MSDVTEEPPLSSEVDPDESSPLVAAALAMVLLVLVGSVGATVLRLSPPVYDLPGLVERHREQSGVDNLVTAVLLNFRAYDTLLEIAVLLLAVLGARSWSDPKAEAGQAARLPTGPVLVGFLRLLMPMIVIVAGYLLWVGAYEPGGAFQSGAVLAAGGVLLLLSDLRWFRHWNDFMERLLLSAGLAVFLGVGLGGMFNDREFLEYPPRWAYELIFVIEILSVLSIAVVLAALFGGGRLGGAPLSESRSTRRERRR